MLFPLYLFIYFPLRVSLFAVDTLCFSGCRARCARSPLFPTIACFVLLVWKTRKD